MFNNLSKHILPSKVQVAKLVFKFLSTAKYTAITMVATNRIKSLY